MRFKVAAFLKIVSIVLATMLLTLLYEAAETIWLPHISMWQSHAITIVYCTLGALLVSLVIVRRQKRIGVRTAQEANFVAAVQHLPGLSCIVKSDRLVRWNSRFQRSLGYSAAELLQMQAAQTLAEEYREILPASMEAAYKTGRADVEAAWLTKSGHKIPCNITGIPVLVGGEPCILGIGMDISEKQRVQEALSTSEEQYRRLLSNLPDITWTIDGGGRIHYVSPNIEDILGYTPDEVIGGDTAQRVSRIHSDDQAM